MKKTLLCVGILAALAGCDDSTSSDNSVTAPDLKPANTIPVANNDIAIYNLSEHSLADHNVSMSIDVLANDTDADGDNLVITEAKALQGTVEVSGNEIVYTPKNGVTTRDSKRDVIAYTIQDDQGAQATSYASVFVIQNGKDNNLPEVSHPDKPVVDPGNDGNYGRPVVDPGNDGNYGRPVVDPGNDGNYGRPVVDPGNDGNYGRPVVDPGNDGNYGRPVVDPGNDGNYGRPAVEDPDYGRPVVDPGNDGNYGRPAVEDPDYGRPVVDPGNDSGFNGGFEILPDFQTTVKSGESQSLTKIFAHIPPNSEITDVSALYGDASVMMGNEGHLVIGYTAPLYDDHSFDTVTYAVQLDSGDYAVGNVIVNVVVDSDNGLVRPNLPDGNTPTVRPNLPDGNTPTVDSTTQREFEIYEQDGKLKHPDVVVTTGDDHGKPSAVLAGYEISLPIAYKQEEGTKADAIYGVALENIPGHYEDKNGSFYYFPSAEQLNKTQNDYVIVPAVNKITGKRREFSYEIQYRGKVVSEPVSVAKPEPAQIWALSDQDFPDSSYSVDSSGVIIDSFGKPVPASDGSKLYAFVAVSGESENVNDEFGRFGRVDTLCMRKDSNSSCNEVTPEFISGISRFIPVPASQLKDGYELTISSVYNLPQINGNPDQSEVVYASPVLLDIK